MLNLLMNGQIGVFLVVLMAIIFSLTLHEFGHAGAAKLLGDDTAERSGRLSLNPFVHLDPVGLLMVVLIGFGYAKPVPMNTRVLSRPWARAFVAAAGPAMNLLLAVVAVNFLVWAMRPNGVQLTDIEVVALSIMANINLLLMLFNLIPLGDLDGHYLVSWLLPRNVRARYDYLNHQYGSKVFIVLILLSFLGLPIFNFLMTMGNALVPYITFVRG